MTTAFETRELTPYLLTPPPLRRPDATQVFPVFTPARVAVPLPPRPEPAQVFEPDRPRGHRGAHRRPARPLLAYVTASLGLALVTASAGFIAAVAVLA